MVDLPAELRTQLIGRTFKRIVLGESGAAVWRCTGPQAPPLYLKTAALSDGLQLHDEARRLQWMKERGVAVPGVTAYARAGDHEYLLIEAVAGVPASHPHWVASAGAVVRALGTGLARLHATSIDGCPFDQRVAGQIAAARARTAAGQVQEDDFDDVRAGRPATELFQELLTLVPHREDLVLTHGDFSLPNIILRVAAPDSVIDVSGFIDCGRAGIADRYQDLALAVRSIDFNFGSSWVPPFFHAYGLSEPCQDKLQFYTLLDEFF